MYNDTSTASNGAAVTPSDSTELAGVRALYVGVAGNVAVVMAGGASLTFVGAAAGSILPLRVTKVMSTNTTATNIIALY